MAAGWLKKLSPIFSPAAQEPWEKDRDDFFKAIKKNKVETIREIASRYPNEALGWNTENGTPLYVAHENKRLDAFKALVELGADINENYTFGKGKSFNPLLRAIERDEPEFLEYIANKGADLSSEKKKCSIVAGIAFHYIFTPIAIAIESGNLQAVKLLLAKGIDPAAPCYGMEIQKTPQLSMSPAKLAESNKQYKMSDFLKRAVLHGPAPSVQPPATTPIGVMQPLKLKQPVGTP